MHNIRQLKRLNTVVFPVSYNDKFYKDVLQAGELARLGKSKYYLRSCMAWFWSGVDGSDKDENTVEMYAEILQVLLNIESFAFS